MDSDNADILFVVHPDPDPARAHISALWGVCRTCGTGSVVQGTSLTGSEVANDAACALWVDAHVCSDTPDYFWLDEYGSPEEYYGLDLDAL